MEMCYIQPDKPSQNAFIKRSNRACGGRVLGANLFEDLGQVWEITCRRMQHSNEERPHDAVGKLLLAHNREATLHLNGAPTHLGTSRAALRLLG